MVVLLVMGRDRANGSIELTRRPTGCAFGGIRRRTRS
jgi:hypothetical protein